MAITDLDKIHKNKPCICLFFNSSKSRLDKSFGIILLNLFLGTHIANKYLLVFVAIFICLYNLNYSWK